MFVISRGRIAFKGIDGKKMFCMFLKSMGRDRAQLLTLDLLLSLVPFVMVLGISANAMSGVVTQMQDYSYTYEKNRELQDAADALIKGPGIPALWHHNVSNASLVGFAAIDEDTGSTIPNYIDFWKYNLANDSIIADVLKTENFNINVTLFNQTAYNLTDLNITLPRGKAIPANATNIRKVERIVIIDNLLRLKVSSEFALSINNTEKGSGRTIVCTESEIELNQFEIDNNNYWIFFNYSIAGGGGTSNFEFSINEREETGFNMGEYLCPSPQPAPTCNVIVTGDDFPNPPDIGGARTGPIPDFYYETRNSCNFAPDNSEDPTNITYYITNTSDNWMVYAIIPKHWLKVGKQWNYLYLVGRVSVTTGWYVAAPEEISRDDLEKFLGLEIPFDDLPAKITITVWDT